MDDNAMRVVHFEEALAIVMGHARLHGSARSRPATKTLPLLEAAGRILTKPVVADRDQPPFDRATRDGFAVGASAFSKALPLKIAGQVRAGERWTGAEMAEDEAIEIMTGAPVPFGADAVAMIEHVQVNGGTVQAAGGRTLRPGDNIVRRGSEARQREMVVAAGSLIGAAEIALAATCGYSSLVVFAKPRVAIVATGDELVELADQAVDGSTKDLEAWQIRNSNSYGLAAMVDAAGGAPHRLEIARDTREQVRERIAEGRKYNLLLLSGGVSMGKFDLVEEALAELDAEFFFTGVAMQPGKPVVFGRLPGLEDASGAGRECYFFGLPGNPVSTQVTFHCFVEPFLRTIGGEETPGPRFVQATLAEDTAGKPSLTRLLLAHLSYNVKQPSVRLVGWQGSGDLAANARANCYAVLPPERDAFRSGEVISVLLR